MKKFSAVCAVLMMLLSSTAFAESPELNEDEYTANFYPKAVNHGVIDNKDAVVSIEGKNSGRVRINIEGSSNVGKSVFDALAKKDEVEVLFFAEDYQWLFAGGQEVSTTKFQYNLGAYFNDPLQYRYEKLLGDKAAKVACVKFYSQTALPFTANLCVDTDFDEDDTAYVYTYNKEQQKAQLIMGDLEVSVSGKVTIPMNATTNFFITNKPIEASNII